MAAEVIARAGFKVSVYDAMPSVGRKFLLAGVGGMNITHAEPSAQFLSRYGAARDHLTPIINAFDATALRTWVESLGIETFVGTSGRVFPKEMKAAPLLRAWLHRLRESGVSFYPRHRWLGWTQEGALRFRVASADDKEDKKDKEERTFSAKACVLALGGASWPRLGSDGTWIETLSEYDLAIAALQPSNCGFECNWSDIFRSRCAGQPLNTVSLSLVDRQGRQHHQRGECVITEQGIEGSAIYAISALARELINRDQRARLILDLLPDLNIHKIIQLLQKPRGKDSQSNFLRKQLKLPPVKLQLLRELTSADIWHDPAQLAHAIKCLPLELVATRPLAEAISSAGGIAFPELDHNMMLGKIPGVFCAGEMLDWEAPTGGYLLTACFATGRAAGQGVVDWLGGEPRSQ